MNQKIKDLLRFSDEPVQLYAAARIEELETATIPVSWIEKYVSEIRVKRDKYVFRSKRYEELDCDALLIEEMVEAYDKARELV